MKQLKIFVFALLGVFLAGAGNVYSADPVQFGLFNYTSYVNKKVVVGDTIRMFPYVDANDHNGLNVINMKLKISDTTVVAPVDQSSFFTPGATYSQLGFQKYADGVMEVLVYIDPNDKPTERSAYVGEIKLKALKTGSATISFESLEVTEEENEDTFVETTNSPLDITVVSASSSSVSAASSSASASTSPTTESASVATSTATVKSASTRVTGSLSGVSTGPIGAILGSLFGGTVVYIFVKKRGKRDEK